MSSARARARRGLSGRSRVVVIAGGRLRLPRTVWNPPIPLLFQRRYGGEHRPIAGPAVRELITNALAGTGLTDVSGRPLRFVPHDFRRILITDAIMHGMPPHIAQLVVGHRTSTSPWATRPSTPKRSSTATGPSSPAAAAAHYAPARNTAPRPSRSGPSSSATSSAARSHWDSRFEDVQSSAHRRGPPITVGGSEQLPADRLALRRRHVEHHLVVGLDTRIGANVHHDRAPVAQPQEVSRVYAAGQRTGTTTPVEHASFAIILLYRPIQEIIGAPGGRVPRCPEPRTYHHRRVTGKPSTPDLGNTSRCHSI